MKQMSRILSVLMIAALLLSGCNAGPCTHEWNPTDGTCKLCGEGCSHNWNAETGFCRTCYYQCRHPGEIPADTACGICGKVATFETLTTTDVVGYETTFVRIPDMWTGHCEQSGKIERLDYTTDAYGDGVTYDRFVRVYVPYGYDPNDTSTKYNVIYFQHGNTGSQNTMTNSKMVRLFDNIFARSDIEKCIIVCPTYYLSQDQTKAGDGWDGGEFLYYKEIIEDVIPLVESHYNTYTETFDEAGLKASREHRAFTGYSRGSACTWNMFTHALEYFKWFSPMSCNFMGADHTAGIDNEQAFQLLKAAIDAHPELDFFIYAASGGPEDATFMRTQMRDFLQHTEVFSFGTDPAVNNIYYSIADYPHSDEYVPYFYYNSLQVFFR